MTNCALVVVDMLYDFIDGSLACQNAEEAVKQTLRFIDSRTEGNEGAENEILDTFPILFIRDHHPADHCSFKSEGGIWPSHCVNNAGQSLEEVRELLDARDVYVCGIATEYCVRNTCEDLLKAGFRVHLIKDALAWVDAESHMAALSAMSAEGICLE